MNLYLRDIGIVNALGAGKSQVLDQLLAGSTSGMTPIGPLLTGRGSVAGVVNSPLAGISDDLAIFRCRNNRLLATALRQIQPAITEEIEIYGRDRIAVVVGTSTSGIAASEDAHKIRSESGTFPADFHYRQQEIGTAAEFAARYLGISGPRFTISTACSSSAKAVISAARLIRAGRCDAAVVGGSDSLCQMTLNGFDALKSLAPDRCNPFSRNRCGINIGEGACMSVLSRTHGPVQLMGSGESSDGHHMAAPDPTGRGAEIAIRSALASADVGTDDIDYINLHGTATPKNDQMEGRVVNRLFGTNVACSSTKTQIGHTLGAAGSQEFGLCWLLLSEDNQDRLLPPHLWDEAQDPAIPEINLIGQSNTWSNGIIMANTFGFGGSNASLILKRTE